MKYSIDVLKQQYIFLCEKSPEIMMNKGIQSINKN